MLNLSVVGLGYWGPNYLRVFKELDMVALKICCDLDKNNLKKINELYPDIELTSNYLEVVRDSNVDAVVITTPLSAHYKIAVACLNSGKHILIEKPFVSDSREAIELIELAEQKNLILAVGHIFEHNQGVIKLKEIIKSEIGEIYYLYSERSGLGPIRKQANVLWDLATHDIYIDICLLERLPDTVFCKGMHYIQDGVEDIIFLSMQFYNNIIFNVYASWIAPEKTRKITAVGSNCMVVYDDVSKSEKIKIYDRKLDKTLIDSTPAYHDHQMVVRMGNVRIPKVVQSEPLKNLVLDFIDSIINKRKPLVDGHSGLGVVKVLEAAERSLNHKYGVVRVK